MNMHALHSPQEAYRRVDFDARIAGAGPQDLVILCYEQLDTALGSALLAAERGDNSTKSQCLTRALAAITALHLGVDHGQAVSSALSTYYDSARRTVLDSVLRFDPARLDLLRSDSREIAGALRSAA
jgi:flagellin-specific chaperone FliS